MLKPAATVTEQVLRPSYDPQRRAWGILLLSFAAFCAICVVAGVSISYFLFQSTVSLESLLRVGRGTGVVSGQAVYSERVLVLGDTLSTDGQSQATIFFTDTQSENRLIAMVTLKGGTEMSFRRTLRPRFDWGSSSYGIELERLSGELDVFVMPFLQRDVRLTIRTVPGDLIDIQSSGQYRISATETRARVENVNGSASLIPANQNVGRSIPANNQGIVNYTGDATSVLTSPAKVNLITSSTFEDPDVIAQSWVCSNREDTPPSGRYYLERTNGRMVMRMLRADGATSNGETRCLTSFGQYGLDVAAYTYLELRVMFNIQYQSLEVCGTQGSECPLMLRIDYRDQQGASRQWIHGFYSRPNPQLNYPLYCLSCTQEHELVNASTWYTYDTGNLLSFFAPGERPISIVNVQFYASGHQYDVLVSDVSLLAGSTDDPTALN
ncbi:MAG: hypothetical protein JNJ61_15240 [Anaerolineae bacterium]|nr:hypothetical protein [Anaerolineae bacterium]